MKNTTHYKATFSNGRVEEIKKSTRIYTHAWKFTATDNTDAKKSYSGIGFAGRKDLAEKAASSESRYYRQRGMTIQFDVVPVEVVQ